MILKKAVEQVINSGVKPIVLDVQRVLDFSGNVEGLRTSLVIRSLELGVLTANEYRFVARRTEQGSKLVEKNLDKLFYFYHDLKKEFAQAKFFTVSVYARALLNGELFKTLELFFKNNPLVEPESICLEISADILFEVIVAYKKEILRLKQLGVKIALCEVASEFCPLLRLNEIDYDVVFLDQYFVDSIIDESYESQANAIINVIGSRPVKIYGSCIESNDLPYLEKFGVDGYTLKADAELQNKEWRVGGNE